MHSGITKFIPILLFGLCQPPLSVKAVEQDSFLDGISLIKGLTSDAQEGTLTISTYTECHSGAVSRPSIRRTVATFLDRNSYDRSIHLPLHVAVASLKSLYKLAEVDLCDPLLNPLSNREIHRFVSIMQELLAHDESGQEEYLRLRYDLRNWQEDSAIEWE